MSRLLPLALALLAAPALAQGVSLDLVGTVTFPATSSGNGTSDVWGYTAPDGAEYALVGILDGTAIVSVPELEVLHTIPGPQGGTFYYHRDMVVHEGFLYVVSEMVGTNEGLQVIDLRGLPETAELVTTVATPGNVRSHNMDVDAVTGYAYVLAQNASAVRIFDLADPADPQEVGEVDVQHVHDVHARGDTLYVAEGWEGSFSIWDVSNKQAPQLLARVEVPNAGYVHNIWPSDDGRHVVTTEETQGKTVKVWDVTDLGDVELVGEYLGANGLAHNAHWMGRHVVLSHYRAGVIVVDVSAPSAPVEVARYDTTPESDGDGFFGTWGAFPYTAGGYVYGSDFDGVLTVLELVETTTAGEPAAPTTTLLAEAYPNPFRGRAAVTFELAEAGPVRATLHDVLGREVAVLADGARAAGQHTLHVEGAELRPGSYLVRLEAGGARQALTLVRVR